MIQPFPRPINPKVKKQTDDQLTKLGQLNQLVRDINNLNVGSTAYTGIPFENYPPASLVNEGPKFTYLPTQYAPELGIVELISYHIKGISAISNSGIGFEQYLCSFNFSEVGMGIPFIFPGSITGMFQSGTGPDIITTPLANGGLIELDGNHVPVSDFQINLYSYGNNPQPDGSVNYALVISATTVDSGNISALVAYDYEILLPNFVKAPTIFQD